MAETENNIADGNLTQKEIIQLLLHNAQHMATREEVKSDIKDLKAEIKEDMSKVEISLKEDISRVETSLKEDMSKLEVNISRVETSLKEDISKVETSLKDDNKNLSKRMDRFMFWSLGLTITSTFLILGFMYKILL